FFEQLMQAYTKAGNLDAALHVAMTMAGMTSALSPARLRRQAEKALDKCGATEPDLSHLTDEQLQGMRELLEPGKIAAPTSADAHCVATPDAELAFSDPPDQSD